MKSVLIPYLFRIDHGRGQGPSPGICAQRHSTRFGAAATPNMESGYQLAEVQGEGPFLRDGASRLLSPYLLANNGQRWFGRKSLDSLWRD